MTSWRPIIPAGSPAATRAWEAVDAISQAIAVHNYPPPIKSVRVHRIYEEALLFAYVARAKRDQQWSERAIARLNDAVAEAPRLLPSLGLHGGLCGLGWVLEHAPGLLESPPLEFDEVGDETDEDLNEQTDNEVVSRLRAAPGVNYDLISGLVGWGIYFLQRFPRGQSEEGIALIVKRLDELSERHPSLVTWFTPSDLLPAWQREICPLGYYNLGVAHGIPGIIHFLSEARQTGVEKVTSGRLLEGAVEWFLGQQRPSASRGRFSPWTAPGIPSGDSRPTWCYGDLGILSVLLQASKSAGREDWRSFALQLLDDCLARPAETAGIRDAALCHGATGSAHIFNRICQAEGDQRCLRASLEWFDRALEMRKPGEGVGGFFAFTQPEREGEVIWEASPAFVDGAVGVALALLAAITSVEPGWDRTLLLSGDAATRSNMPAGI